MFGEGVHPTVEGLYERQLAPWLSQTSHAFWKQRLSYFRSGLYYHGGMVRPLCCLPCCVGGCQVVSSYEFDMCVVEQMTESG